MKKKTIWISAAAAVVVLGAAGIVVAVTEPFDGDDRLSGQTLEKASDAAIAEVGEGTVSDASTSEDLDHAYDVEVRLANGSEVDVALDENYDVVWTDRSDDDSTNTRDNDGDDSSNGATTGTDSGSTSDATAAPQGSGDSDDAPLTDAERTGAEQAALAETGDGTVTDIDRSDDADHAFEVEVTFADGRDVDVELTADFQVVRVDDDSQPATN